LQDQEGLVDGEAPQYHTSEVAATQAASDEPGHCHAGAPSLWPPTFLDTSGELSCTDG